MVRLVDGALAMVDIVARESLLFAGLGLLIGGIDDLIIDLIYIVRNLKRRVTVYRRHQRASVEDFPLPSRRFAMFVPAWDEGDVIGAMLRTTLARLSYRDLTIFVGCYANDRGSVDSAAAIAERDGRVVLVINPVPGPTTKADNLNALWRALERFEADNGRFHAIILHDAEDVVAAAEIRVFEHLLDRADVVQLPVLPLVDRGSRWISGHYCDEFAEWHVKQLVVREALGAAMPLAGTGFAIRRDLLGDLADDRGGAPFDAESLTEDYELGLALGAGGARAMLARVPVKPNGPPVCVRAHFPATLDAAVKQKARWMTGIALAGWDRVGWARARTWRENWMRMRDRRALLAVFVLAAAYLGLVTWATGVGLRWLAGLPWVSLDVPAWLLMVTAVLMLWRLVVRASIVGGAYGWREGLRSIPRALVANLIALLAARRAISRYIAMLRGGDALWEKTGHVFPRTLPAE